MMHANKQKNHARRRPGLVLALVGLLSVTDLVKGPTTPASAQADAPSWSYTGSLNVARSYHTATRLPDGKVLVAGGNETGAPDSAELYDPVTGTWSFTGRLNAPRSSHTATLLQNGMVLIAGGGDEGKNLNTAELYDPVTGAWSATGSLNIERSGHTATLLQNGKVLVSGTAELFVGTAELYDPVTGAWSPTGSLNIWRNDHTTATLLQNGKVLVAGGQAGDAGSVRRTELYDPTTGTWSVTGGLDSSHGGHTATLLPNGDVLVAGECLDGLFCANKSSAELYNPTTGTWSITRPLKKPRGSHTATLLPNGKVLVAGGGSLVSELYAPATGKWNTTASLNTARHSHTATLLQNGKVLVVGGMSAELYDPEILDPAPKIISASVSGKKLLITGENFDDGAVILLNGEEQKSKNDEQNPGTNLIGKKAGKNIKAGDKLQVRNPDGTLSAEFIFTGSQD